MRCADCKREINKPALVIGSYVFGPVCARRYVVAPTRTLTPVPIRITSRPAVFDPAQTELEFA